MSLDGWDSILSILQMPPGIPVATVGLNAAKNAGILAAQILGVADNKIQETVKAFKANLEKKIVEANKELESVKYEFKVN
jgi:5-(carboxyamino)imidazole ribonucleotide mutase